MSKTTNDLQTVVRLIAIIGIECLLIAPILVVRHVAVLRPVLTYSPSVLVRLTGGAGGKAKNSSRLRLTSSSSEMTPSNSFSRFK